MLAGQAQKEFTVNEALALTDALLHCAVEGTLATPPASSTDGECWLVDATATDAWAGHEGEIACRQSGTWLFAAPRDGLRLLDRSSGQFLTFRAGWHAPSTPDSPAGGTTVDSEARAAIDALIDALQAAGVLAPA